MAKTVFFVVQPFVMGRRGALVAGSAREARNAAEAERIAQRMAGMTAGAIAFSRAVDPDSDDAGPPALIATFGRVPEEALEVG